MSVQTAAGKALLRWIEMVEKVDDPAGNTIYDEVRLTFLPAIEQEAAALALGRVEAAALRLPQYQRVPVAQRRAPVDRNAVLAAIAAARGDPEFGKDEETLR